MRWLTALILMAVLVAPVAAQPAPALPAVVESVDRAVVLISVVVDSGGRLARGSGSGVVIEPSGLVLTANHVIARARQIDVTLWNGETYAGRVVGADPLFDAALVRIDPRLPLPAAALGGSSQLHPGEMLAALGRSPRRQNGPTTGSFLEADLEARPGVPYLRTSATVWPGDSGGALVNERGEVIALIVAITRDGTVSLGVAIDAIKFYMADLRAGIVRHPWLGVTGVTVTDRLVQELGLAVHSGVLVFDVVPGGPAAQAGLRGGTAVGASDIPRGGDIIVAIDGRPVVSFGAMAAYILSRRIGDAVSIEFVRGGQTLSITAVLAERPQI